MANENSKNPTQAKPQVIPLSKIHDLPGVFNPKPQDKSLGSMVLSIESSGVKEAVILRQRDDGEYQLLSGYRRRRASELAKKQDIPAHVYEMTMQEAIAYRKAVKNNPNVPIPGKLLEPVPDKDKTPVVPGSKGKASVTPAVSGGTDKAGEAPAVPDGKGKEGEAPTVSGGKGKEGEPPAVPGGKGKEGESPAVPGGKGKEGESPAAPGGKGKEGEAPTIPGGTDKVATAPKNQPNQPAEGKHTPTVAELEAQVKAGNRISLTDLATATHAEREAQKGGITQLEAPSQDKGEAPAVAITGPAAKGPAGTAISQVLPERLVPPDETARKDFPAPKGDESIFVVLHPAYLEKSPYNTVSVDTRSEDYLELKKSIELNGVKDPVLTRIGNQGTLEIISGQRRHMIATELNYPVPTIIQYISDADAKILVADGNLHRPKISSYDLSRTLRMKMEGMKQKAGRRKRGYSANELQSDAKLAQEMGMSVAKLNRLIRMSEAVKGVCDLVDEGKLTVSVAAEISALKPETQESVLHLLDLGYKATNERISRMKKAEGGGQELDDMDLRSILDDKDIAPKQTEPPAHTTSTSPEPAGGFAPQPPIPASPDVPENSDTPAPSDTPPWEEPEKAPALEQGDEQTSPGTHTSGPEKEDDPLKGPQERPEVTKVILTGDRLRKYFPDVSMTPREIEESVYSALEERRQRQIKEEQKAAIFKRGGLGR